MLSPRVEPGPQWPRRRSVITPRLWIVAAALAFLVVVLNVDQLLN
jgi:hypothetical protein